MKQGVATVADGWRPTSELERRLGDAVRNGDQEGYFRLLADSELVVPVPPDLVDGVLANERQPAWPTQVEDDRTFVLAYTSPSAMRACLGPSYRHYVRLRFTVLAASWPDHNWWLAVDVPAHAVGGVSLPIEGRLPAWFVLQLAQGDARPPVAGHHAAASASPSSPAPASPASDLGAPSPDPASDLGVPVGPGTPPGLGVPSSPAASSASGMPSEAAAPSGTSAEPTMSSASGAPSGPGLPADDHGQPADSGATSASGASSGSGVASEAAASSFTGAPLAAGEPFDTGAPSEASASSASGAPFDVAGSSDGGVPSAYSEPAAPVPGVAPAAYPTPPAVPYPTSPLNEGYVPADGPSASAQPNPGDGAGTPEQPGFSATGEMGTQAQAPLPPNPYTSGEPYAPEQPLVTGGEPSDQGRPPFAQPQPADAPGQDGDGGAQPPAPAPQGTGHPPAFDVPAGQAPSASARTGYPAAPAAGPAPASREDVSVAGHTGTPAEADESAPRTDDPRATIPDLSVYLRDEATTPGEAAPPPLADEPGAGYDTERPLPPGIADMPPVPEPPQPPAAEAPQPPAAEAPQPAAAEA
ncbi:hypothetical protein DZF91_06455, partial [Actinomadura logoneensis]